MGRKRMFTLVIATPLLAALAFFAAGLAALAGVIAAVDRRGERASRRPDHRPSAQRGLEALLPGKDLAVLARSRPDYARQITMVVFHVLVFAGATLLSLRQQSRAKVNT